MLDKNDITKMIWTGDVSIVITFSRDTTLKVICFFKKKGWWNQFL